MKYLVKTTEINIKTLQTFVFFIGKDGYVQTKKEYCDGWSRKHFAESYIQKDIDAPYRQRIDEYCCVENKEWFEKYEIVEVEEK